MNGSGEAREISSWSGGVITSSESPIMDAVRAAIEARADALSMAKPPDADALADAIAPSADAACDAPEAIAIRPAAAIMVPEPTC